MSQNVFSRRTPCSWASVTMAHKKIFSNIDKVFPSHISLLIQYNNLSLLPTSWSGTSSKYSAWYSFFSQSFIITSCTKYTSISWHLFINSPNRVSPFCKYSTTCESVSRGIDSRFSIPYLIYPITNEFLGCQRSLIILLEAFFQNVKSLPISPYSKDFARFLVTYIFVIAIENKHWSALICTPPSQKYFSDSSLHCKASRNKPSTYKW